MEYYICLQVKLTIEYAPKISACSALCHFFHGQCCILGLQEKTNTPHYRLFYTFWQCTCRTPPYFLNLLLRDFNMWFVNIFCSRIQWFWMRILQQYKKPCQIIFYYTNFKCRPTEASNIDVFPRSFRTARTITSPF